MADSSGASVNLIGQLLFIRLNVFRLPVEALGRGKGSVHCFMIQ